MPEKLSPVKTRKIAITIGRQFGSGGRELGKKLAARLDIPYYDKELLSRAASGSGIAEEFIVSRDERQSGFLGSSISFSMGFSPVTWYQRPSSISAEAIHAAQAEAIRSLAAESSCVIVGRSADYILRDHPDTVNIFVSAPENVCIDRILSRGDSTPDKARRLLEKTNRLRANFYNFYTDKTWGHAKSYDLCFDTSKISIDAIVSLVEEYINLRFA